MNKLIDLIMNLIDKYRNVDKSINIPIIKREIKCIIIHHSLSDDTKTRNWDAIREYHIHENGWSDIGYHYGVEQINDEVRIMIGRPLDVMGAHILGLNHKSIGICLVGNYDKKAPSKEKWTRLLSLVRKLQYRFDILSTHVFGHGEAQKMLNASHVKSCPGIKFNMRKFRREL